MLIFSGLSWVVFIGSKKEKLVDVFFFFVEFSAVSARLVGRDYKPDGAIESDCFSVLLFYHLPVTACSLYSNMKTQLLRVRL